MTYFQITTTEEPGYPSQFCCERCFDIAEEYDRAKSIERCETDAYPRAGEAGVFCTRCNVELAEPDADIVVTALDIDFMMSELSL